MKELLFLFRVLEEFLYDVRHKCDVVHLLILRLQFFSY